MIIFRNKGLIDPLAITTFGVSSKEGENPIGQFGTGLKYAIAIVLRLGGEIAIWSGRTPYRFTVREQKIRRDTFELVLMNGESAGFTNQVGPHWEAWMAFREIYSNCIDEAGTAWSTADYPDAKELPDDSTTIIVKGANFDQLFEERGDIFLRTQPVASLPGVDIHAGSSAHAFYRGIRVYKLPTPSLYTYNLTGYATLTEDRTLAYPGVVGPKVAQAYIQSREVPMLRDALTNEKQFEAKLPWGDQRATTPSAEFMKAASDLASEKKLRGTARDLFKHHHNRIATFASYAKVVKPSPIEQSVIDRARQLLTEKGIQNDQFEIVLKSSMPGKMMALHLKGQQKIELAAEMLIRGDIAVAIALLWAIARVEGSDTPQQLCHFILTGSFFDPARPERLQMEFADAAESGQETNDEMPF